MRSGHYGGEITTCNLLTITGHDVQEKRYHVACVQFDFRSSALGTYFLIGFGVDLCCSLIGERLNKRKGRSRREAWVACMLLGPVGLLMLWLIPEPKKQDPWDW